MGNYKYIVKKTMFSWWVQAMVNFCESIMNLEFILSLKCLKNISLGFEWLKYFRVFHEVSQLVLIISKLSLFWFENKGLQNAPRVFKVIVTNWQLSLIYHLWDLTFVIKHSNLNNSTTPNTLFEMQYNANTFLY
jgi:hypothetical protein